MGNSWPCMLLRTSVKGMEVESSKVGVGKMCRVWTGSGGGVGGFCGRADDEGTGSMKS